MSSGDKGVQSPQGAISPNSLSPKALKVGMNSPKRANTPPQNRMRTDPGATLIKKVHVLVHVHQE